MLLLQSIVADVETHFCSKCSAIEGASISIPTPDPRTILQKTLRVLQELEEGEVYHEMLSLGHVVSVTQMTHSSNGDYIGPAQDHTS